MWIHNTAEYSISIIRNHIPNTARHSNQSINHSIKNEYFLMHDWCSPRTLWTFLNMFRGKCRQNKLPACSSQPFRFLYQHIIKASICACFITCFNLPSRIELESYVFPTQLGVLVLSSTFGRPLLLPSSRLGLRLPLTKWKLLSIIQSNNSFKD